MDKQVYDLKEEDIKGCPVWYFPLDGSVEDELTVRPLKKEDYLNNYQLLVRTNFEDSLGNIYMGYVYWDKSNSVEYIQPVIFTNNDECINLWNGMIEATWEDYNNEQQKIRNYFPIKYTSQCFSNLPSLVGTLDGIYYLAGNKIKCKP